MKNRLTGKKMSILLNSNLKKILIILVPLVITGIAITGYFIYQNNFKKEKTKVEVEKEIVKNDDNIKNIFPEINAKDFYDLIEFKNGLPTIGEVMLAAIIKDVITRMSNHEGNISFYIIKNNELESTIYFKWIKDKEIIKKTYIISLNTL